MQKILKSVEVFQKKIECVLRELWSQMYCHVFFRSTVYSWWYYTLACVLSVRRKASMLLRSLARRTSTMSLTSVRTASARTTSSAALYHTQYTPISTISYLVYNRQSQTSSSLGTPRDRHTNRHHTRMHQSTLHHTQHTAWANKNEITLVRPTAATVRSKIKRISIKCSQSLRE